jgi:thymidylate kinase
MTQLATPLIIEFIGTPGAGKTTLVPAAGEYFNSRGFQARSVLEAARPFAERTLPGRAVRLLAPASIRQPLQWQLFYHLSNWKRSGFFARNRELTDMVLRFQRTRPISEADREHVLRWFLHLAGRYEFLNAHARPGEVLIFDEGFVHRVVQLFASEAEEPEPGRVKAYLDRVPRPDVVVFPYASPETCEQRVWRRGLWERFRSKSAAEVSRFIANSHAIVGLAVAHIRAAGWTVIEVDNDGTDPQVAKAALHRQLTSLFAEPTALTSMQQRV